MIAWIGSTATKKDGSELAGLNVKLNELVLFTFS
jgi:hypothetical protein